MYVYQSGLCGTGEDPEFATPHDWRRNQPPRSRLRTPNPGSCSLPTLKTGSAEYRASFQSLPSPSPEKLDRREHKAGDFARSASLLADRAVRRWRKQMAHTRSRVLREEWYAILACTRPRTDHTATSPVPRSAAAGFEDSSR